MNDNEQIVQSTEPVIKEFIVTFPGDKGYYVIEASKYRVARDYAIEHFGFTNMVITPRAEFKSLPYWMGERNRLRAIRDYQPQVT